MQFVLFEELGDSVDIEGIARKRGFHPGLGRIDHVGLGQLQFGKLSQLIGERRVARLEPGVLSQPHDRRRTAFGGHLVVQQHMEPLVYSAAGIDVGDLMGFGEVVLLQVELRAVNHDLQVLPDILILFFWQLFLELREDRAGFGGLGHIVFMRRGGNLFVVFAQAFGRC